jgi:hypothetical protein
MRDAKKKTRRLWMIHQRFKPTLISPLTKAMLKKNLSRLFNSVSQEWKDCPPRSFWNLVDILPQVQLSNEHLVFFKVMSPQVICQQ